MDIEFVETYTEYEEIDDLSALEDNDEPQAEEPIQEGAFPQPLYQLKLEYSQETFYATTTELNLQSGDYVISPTRYGDDMARVMGLVQHPIRVAIKDIVTVSRKATEEDFRRAEENIEKEKTASALFKEKVIAHKLDMKLIDCHYLLEDPKVIFFFTADTRIDFRKLVKDLVAILRLRIELRQIGVRDESRIAGGIGCCGRPFCCHAVTDKLRPVSIKMAKEQNLSLNSLKISGQCGRLLCCLSYEYDWYVETRKKLPSIGTSLYYDNTLFRISEINLITGIIALAGEDGRVISMPAQRFSQQHGKWKIN
ncbi:regulatory iron-sulfur-containing complex subunit RicT [Treponema sp. OMZ 838]|uniref:PSP1 domain-containing protein n=1 Tax=Treponema sp. OMZ 838 TaxID=1539298 RepID=UPI00068F6828|nr:regulatory iron-sulfur-containing complex subunit RicT [Treponema sp. OMZ 838]